MPHRLDDAAVSTAGDPRSDRTGLPVDARHGGGIGDILGAAASERAAA